MKKTLLAMAIAGVIAAPMAQADSANTTIYGKIHYSWDFVNDDTAVADTTDDADDVSGANNASRIGFKGTEDLGNGMKALYLVETGVGGSLGSRLSYAGLTAGWGTILIGQQYKPYKLATSSLDLFGDTIGDHNEIISNGHYGNNYESAANAVAYASPKMSGAQFIIGRVSMDANEEAGDEETEGTSLSVTYGAGPLYVGFGWENQTGPQAGAGTGSDVDAIKLGASYTMGDAKVNFEWENIQEDNNGVETVDSDRWNLGGSYKMGANTLKASYGVMDDNGAVAGSDDGGKFMAVGLDHAMSKRTTVYALYAKTSNDTNGSIDIGNYSSRGSNLDVSAFSLGLVHNF